LIADHYIPVEFDSWSDAIAKTHCGKSLSSDSVKNNIASKMNVTLTFYPNPCADQPPYLP